MRRNAEPTVDGKAVAIGVLAVSASVLFVGLMLTALNPAQAIGLSDRAGDYKMLTQQISRSKELVVVLDGAARTAAVYDFDWVTKRLKIAAVIPLDQLPKAPAEDDRRARAGQRIP